MVPFAGHELDGLVLPDGTYALSQSQVAKAIGKHHSSAAQFLESEEVKAILDKEFRLRTFEVEIVQKLCN